MSEGRLRLRVERAIEVVAEAAARLGLLPLASWLARPLLVGEDVCPQPFVVVLAGGIRANGQLNEATRVRIACAVRLFHGGFAGRMIVSGGRRAPHRPSCAPRMKALAVALGVPPEQILVEERSSRTAENAREVAQLLGAGGGASILLVTSPLHMRRAKLSFEKQGIRVCAAPAPRGALEASPTHPGMLQQVLYEYLGLAYYRAQGWV